MTEPKLAPSTFRFTAQVKDALALIAEREGRSMSNMLEWLIKKHCETAGLGWPPKDVRAATVAGAKRAGKKGP